MLSKNGVAIVMLVLSLFGVNVTDSDVVGLLSALSTIISFGMMVYNQLNRADTKFFIFKK
jgi:uncharacterized protein (DUF697 family)